MVCTSELSGACDKTSLMRLTAISGLLERINQTRKNKFTPLKSCLYGRDKDQAVVAILRAAAAKNSDILKSFNSYH
jgi:hypothetical protein